MVRAIITVLAVALIVYCIIETSRYDGEPSCKPEDCETCPFPRCNDDERKRHTTK